MSRITRNQTTGMVVVSGTVEALSEDNLNVIIKTSQRNPATNQYDDVMFQATLPAPAAPEDFPKGAMVTACGYQNGANAIRAEVCTTENLYYQINDKQAVLAGNIMFSNYRTEIDEATGQPKLNNAGAPRKPHQDVTIVVGTGRDRVSHIAKVYNFVDKKTGTLRDNIAQIQKRLEKFDRETNPMYACFITQPGTPYTYQTERNGKTYDNTNMTHMGINSLDLNYTRSRQQQLGATAPQQTAPTPAPAAPQPAAPQQAAPVPAVAQQTQPNGFNLAGLDLDGLDGIDEPIY